MPRTYCFSFFIYYASVDDSNKNISKLLANFCNDTSKYLDDVGLAATIRQACELVVKNVSWSCNTGSTVTHFSRKTLSYTLMPIVHIDDKELFETALLLSQVTKTLNSRKLSSP
jgi:hypothetical protein